MKTNVKLITSLIKRIEIRLPINSVDKSIETLEQDPIAQHTVAAIIELSVHKLPIIANQLALVLEPLSKNVQSTAVMQIPNDPYIPLDVLQSQLFIIRLLSACFQHHWIWYQKQSIKISHETNITEEAAAAAAATGTGTGTYPDMNTRSISTSTSKSINSVTTKLSSVQLYTKRRNHVDPPALDESLVSSLLTLLIRFLSQMHVLEERHDQTVNTISSPEQSNDGLIQASKIDLQKIECIREVNSTAGKILFYISASNWNLYYKKIKDAANALARIIENSDPTPPDIRILAFACLNVSKLQTLLTDLNASFLSMKTQGKLLFAKMMRMSIWKWIETKPYQFTELYENINNKPLIGSDVLFDMCNAAADSTRKKSVLWPLQSILLTLSPELLIQAFMDDRGIQNRRTVFPHQLQKALQSSRTQEISAVCYVDICKAATYIAPKEDNILRRIAADVEDLLREKIWNFSRSSSVDALSSSLGYTVSHSALATDYFLAYLRFDPKKTLSSLIPTLFSSSSVENNGSSQHSDTVNLLVFRLAFVNACLSIIADEYPLPWNPTISSMYKYICAPLRRIFIETVKKELSMTTTTHSRSDNVSISTNISGFNKKSNGTSNISCSSNNNGDKKTQQQHLSTLLQNLLKLFKLDPLCALMGEPEDYSRVEGNVSVMASLIHLTKHNDKRVRKSAIDCLIQLHDPSTIKYWGPILTQLNHFWRISSQVILSIARQILDNRQNEETSKSYLDLLAKILVSRNVYLESVVDAAYDNTEVHERLQASVTLEIALLVSLCSPIPDICSTAIKCLGYLCREAKLTDEDSLMETASRSSQSLAGFNHNIEVYEDLSYKEPVVGIRKQQPFVGRKAQQKRVRKYLRMITIPTTGVLMAWEEIWKRWKVLTQVVSRFGMNSSSLRDLNDIVVNSTVSSLSSSSSSVKKIGGLVRHDKLRSSAAARPVVPVPVGWVEIDDEKQTEWQNYTGFLAALGGSRLAADTAENESSNDAKWPKGNHGDTNSSNLITNRIASPSRPNSMIDKFIIEMVDLLTSENVMVREGAKDTLGGDLSPSLYSILFRYLEITMTDCFTASGEVVFDNTNTLFVEQTVLVLKMILDRLTNPNDCLLSIDFSTLIIQLANYINRLPQENYTTMRIMIMMCHLTEVLMLKKEQVILRDDVRVRNKLLETIIEWTSNFNLRVISKRSVSSNNFQHNDVQKDLDQVCLKAVVVILHKLPLQSTDQTRDADRSMNKNRLFQKYFVYFTQLLDRCHRHEAEANTAVRPGINVSTKNQNIILTKPFDSYQYWGPLKESVINAISNLLSANVDVGLKSTLSMGYHEDTRTRTAFMQVLSNILNQGAQFDTLADNIITNRYEKLVDTLVESDINVALSLCDVCPSTDAPGIAQVLLNCFESHGKVLVLLKAVINREVFSTEQEATLFRGTNMATRILSIFARDTCIDYIRLTLQPAMELINALPEANLTWEMDHQKLGPNESVLTNKQNVCRATEIFLEAICNSASNAPRLFRHELSLIVEAVNKRFPDASKTAVGGFVFLRLFNPAILTPENSGFAKTALPKSKMVRKLLLQATRMMQNLANNMMFGAKETHLISLNDFITNNLYRVATFLREISVAPNLNSKFESRGVRMDTIAYMKLHRYLSDNLDKMSRDLSVRRARTSTTDTQRLLEWKRAMDKFSNLLAQLGPPSEITQNELSIIRNLVVVSNNHYYSEFMRRNKHRDLSYINSLNIFYQGGVSKGGRPVFYCITRNVVGENFDFELLIYYMLRIMEPYLNHPFELLFDLSRFSEDIEIPIHWLNQFFQLVFSEMNDYLVALHLFNPNFYMQQYVRKLPRILTNKLVKRTRFAITINELSQYIALSEIRLPKETYEIEKEMGMTITNAYLVTNYKIMIPIKIKIGSEYFIVTTLREQEIFWSLNTILNNVFGMTDLVDVFLPPMSTAKKPTAEGEIHIVYNTGKSVMIIVVPNREEVYRYLLNQKKHFDTNLSETSHGIRPSDVPGRMLNMALLNLGSESYALRSAAYSLLCSLCKSFRFGIEHKLMNVKDLCIQFNNIDFIVNLSENLAASETHLTLEFLNECIVGFNRSSIELSRQIIILEYIVPWLKNLVFFTLVSSSKEYSKVKEVIRSLIIMTAEKSEAYHYIQEKIWKTFGDLEELHHLILDTLIQYSVENGIGSSQAEAMADTIVTMNNVSIHGKVIHRMRRALWSTSRNCRQTLIEQEAWNEIGCLIRYMLMLSFYSENNSKPYGAEVFHIISLIVSIGPTFIRSSVHELVVNCIHLLVTNKDISPGNRKKLKYILDDVCDGKYRVHFGLSKSYANAFTITKETMTDNTDNINLSSLEVIVRLMLDTINYAAPTTDIANIWRARWMSLVTSMTFQYNPALQPRAFVVLGCLAQYEIDDDLLYQILIVLRNELANFDEKMPNLVISILMCLTNIIDNLPSDSRYIKPIFWLAITMIQMNHSGIFLHAVKLLHAVLRTLDSHKCFHSHSIEKVLMDAREPLAEVTQLIDEAADLSFGTQFSFAIAGVLLKDSRNSDARDNIIMCLTTFLEIETKSKVGSNLIDSRCLGYLCGLLPFAAKNNTLLELLRLAGINDIDIDEVNATNDVYSLIWRAIDIPNNTTGILLVSFLVGMLSLADNETERLFLYGFLSKAAISTPEVFALVYDSLIPKMNSIVVSSDNVTLINAVKSILITACSEPAFKSVHNHQQIYLKQIGFNSFGEINFGSMSASTSVSSKLTSELLRLILE
ncbi:MAG: hypothetical protein EXX96DRAFT_507481 [Benjaminiella poitrasii]|nr:MAG: hypothetical protein EXX96DRAFT_507481 [Benjaminiella poitrasii]